MELIARSEGRTYGSMTIQRPEDFAAPFPGALFPCLIWDHRGSFTNTGQEKLAAALLDAGCRYAVCSGAGCEAWHDAIDMEFVHRHLDDPEEVRESMHVMTTWHDGESPEEVASFFVLNTNFGQHDFRQYLVLHVGTGIHKDEIDAAVGYCAKGEQAL